jgi:hypothetical protein
MERRFVDDAETVGSGAQNRESCGDEEVVIYDKTDLCRQTK